MARFYKVSYASDGKVVVRPSLDAKLDKRDAAVFPESISGEKNGERAATFFAEALRGPVPMRGSLEWQDLIGLAKYALAVAPDIYSTYDLPNRLATPLHATQKHEAARAALGSSKLTDEVNDPVAAPRRQPEAATRKVNERANALRQGLHELDHETTRHVVDGLEKDMKQFGEELTQDLRKLADLLGLGSSSAPKHIVKSAIRKLEEATERSQLRRITRALRMYPRDAQKARHEGRSPPA